MNTKSLRLFRRKQIFLPTLSGWILLLGLGGSCALLLVREIHSFLAPYVPVRGQVLVVEGWVPDHAIEMAMEEFGDQEYALLVTVGGPQDVGAPLSPYGSVAEMGAARLVALGFSADAVIAVPGPDVPRERTYAAALSFADWLEHSAPEIRKVDVLSLGCHTRRTWLAYRRVCGERIEVGALAAPVINYDTARWWKTSAGMRTVLGEGIAYAYARLFGAVPELADSLVLGRPIAVKP